MQRLIVCGFFLAFLLLGMLHSVVSIPQVDLRSIPQISVWSGSTVTIQPNGSVTPPSAPIHQAGNVYSLTDSIISDSDGIVVEINNVILDGDWYTIQGSSIGNGVDLTSTSDVTVENANIKNFSIGIFAPSSSNDTMTGNNIQQNSVYGIYVDSSLNDTILGNNIQQNSVCGIYLDSSSYDNILGNNIEQNALYGIWLSSSSGNSIYHNNFVNNTQQVYTTYDSINMWNASYPIGGNYWSDYTTIYPSAAEIDSSGIWNTPYFIDANNQDSYPLMNPWSSSQSGSSGGRMPLLC
jgi:parallel beta-helix repeat protein